MHQLPIHQIVSFVDFVAFQQREPVMVWGAPGVGKSESMAQLAKAKGARLVDIRLSQYDSVDLRGLPDRDGSLTRWLAPSTLPFEGNPAFSDDEPILLFLDELNSASPAVMAVAYQLINDRAVGEHRLKDNVVIVAAANREGDRGVTNRMPKPLANRFTHVEAIIDVDGWCVWAQGAGLPPVGAAFMQFRKPLLSTFDPNNPEKAYATPRTWAKALHYYADERAPLSIKRAAMAGAVGEGPASEFWGFVDVWHKVTPIKEIIADPEGVALPDEPSLIYATAIAVSSDMSDKTVAPLHKFLMRLAPEFVVMAWHMAAKRDETLFATKQFVEFSKKFKVVFN